MLVESFRAMKNELVPESSYPIKLADYILNNIDTEDMRLYNGFNYGSYLEFRGIKTFIDSRSEVFCEEFNPGCTILKDWYAVYNGDKTCSEIFEKYNINYAISSKYEYITQELDNDDNWNLIYEDMYWNLYERK
jgi:hypothetical protein